MKRFADATPIRPISGAVGHYAPLDMLALPGPRFLIALAAARHGVRVRDILSPARRRPVIAARHEAIRLIKRHRPALSSGQIARIMGRHHTTILHALGRTSYSRRLAA